MLSLNVMELEYTEPVILRIWNPALIPCSMVSLATRQPLNAGTLVIMIDSIFDSFPAGDV